MGKRTVDAGCVRAGGMQDSDGIECGRIREYAIGGGLKEVLIALYHAAKREAVERFRHKNLRFHLRVDGLGKDLIEGESEQKRTQVVDIGDGAEAVEVAFGCKTRF